MFVQMVSLTILFIVVFRFLYAGIERLVEEEVFVAAYPLHVVS